MGVIRLFHGRPLQRWLSGSVSIEYEAEGTPVSIWMFGRRISNHSFSIVQPVSHSLYLPRKMQAQIVVFYKRRDSFQSENTSVLFSSIMDFVDTSQAERRFLKTKKHAISKLPTLRLLDRNSTQNTAKVLMACDTKA